MIARRRPQPKVAGKEAAMCVRINLYPKSKEINRVLQPLPYCARVPQALRIVPLTPS